MIGAGQVGFAIVDALHADHEITVLDTEPSRLAAFAERYDVATFEGDGTSRQDLVNAGVATQDLVIACTSRDEVNLVAGMFARAEAKKATTVIRTSNVEYVELWRAGQLDVDFVVCSELETAHAISRIIGVPAARQTDVFAEGQVQIVEFDVQRGASADVVGRPLRDAGIPPDSKVAAIIRGDRDAPARRRRRDPARATGSSSSARPQAAQAWSALLAPGEGKVRDVVIYGAGRVGTAIARVLLEQGIDVRLVEASAERARVVAEAPAGRARLPRDRGRPRLHRARADRADGRGDLRDARRREEPLRRIARRGARRAVHDRHRARGGLGPGVRAGRDRRLGEPARRDGRGDHPLRARSADEAGHASRGQPVRGPRRHAAGTRASTSGKKFKEMPVRGALIGAVVRNGSAMFPHRDDVLQAGDRVIVFTEAADAPRVVKAL